jgi:lipopolysaccharide biosynthesis glycosyltransferase
MFLEYNDKTMTKNLVYFVVGGEPGYVALLDLCLKSLRQHNDQKDFLFDVLVMCDASYVEHLEGIRHRIDHVHLTPHNQTYIHVSMRKLDIFSWPKIDEYEKALFLDCDIIITGPILPMFETMTNPDVVYVVPEIQLNNHWTAHRTKHFGRGDRPYTRLQLHDFGKYKIYVFNCGHFGFCVSGETRRYFEEMAADKEANYSPEHHWYEQSIMNWYLNSMSLLSRKNQRLFPIDYSIGKYVHMVGPQKPLVVSEGAVVVHFLSGESTFANKLRIMEDFFSRQSSS